MRDFKINVFASLFSKSEQGLGRSPKVLQFELQKELHMTAKKVLLVKYGEISLRKGNRAHFEHQLLDTIRNNLKKANHNNLRVSREQGRFLIESTDGDVKSDEFLPIIMHIFGVTGFCHAIKTTARDIADLQPIALEFFREVLARDNSAKSFRVITKRSDKKYPMTSNEISAAIGDTIFHSDLNMQVDLRNPDITLWAEIRNNVYFYVDSIPGMGVLLSGASGKGVLLLSGGFDSPVAGYLTARRGVEILPIYFHSPPFVSERAADKVRDLAAEIAKYTGRIRLHIVPFTEVQLYLRDHVHPEKLTIMLKRAMLRIANSIAEKEKAQCIITGDSIGQVASQTIQSLAAVNSAATLPILRPLSAMDKQDIIDTAMKIGTYPISIRPYEDCCTIFVAKHPESKPNTKVIERIESQIYEGLAPLLEKAVVETVME